MKKASVSYPAEQMTEGWIGGMVLEAALKGAGWPWTRGRCACARRRERRHQGLARRTARMEQGKSLPRAAVLSSLSLG